MINAQYVVITIMKFKKSIGPVTLENCTGCTPPLTPWQLGYRSHRLTMNCKLNCMKMDEWFK